LKLLLESEKVIVVDDDGWYCAIVIPGVMMVMSTAASVITFTVSSSPSNEFHVLLKMNSRTLPGVGRIGRCN
jgi:hypothetical protein